MDSVKPKRRPRYKGTHPRRFHEKYKELNPERYAEDVAKVMARGQTPVGMHRPICLDEILQILAPKSGEIALDATMGYGGHSSALLKKILPDGRLVALDRDPIERPKTETRLRELLKSQGADDSALIVGGINFSEAWSFLRQQDLRVDMVLADLGLSSMQIDTPERGFSFKIEAPFDLRMNPQAGETAAELLVRLNKSEIEQLLVENSDEPHAEQIATALEKHSPQTTVAVAKIVQDVASHWSKSVREKEGDKPIRRVFQSFRIAVNNEFESLDKFLADIPRFLKPGGRVVVLTFHSGEDRRVKKSFQAYARGSVYSAVAADPLRASPEEQRSNPRSSSAKLRWARR